MLVAWPQESGDGRTTLMLNTAFIFKIEVSRVEAYGYHDRVTYRGKVTMSDGQFFHSHNMSADFWAKLKAELERG